MDDPHDLWMRRALRLARRGYGTTSPNPMVGAVLVRGGSVVGEGWHRRAGEPHAEIEALTDARRRGRRTRGSTLYVTLEPCSTHGRTPPCTDAVRDAGIRRVVVGATDPNPRHAGRGYDLLRSYGLEVISGVLEEEATALNEAFNHWVVHRTPFVTVKAAMTLDGKIATAAGESKWITGVPARARGMWLRQGADAVLVGVNTVLADDPSLTVRGRRVAGGSPRSSKSGVSSEAPRRRLVLDSRARTPLTARVVTDAFSALTTLVVTDRAPRRRLATLARRVRVWEAPEDERGGVDLNWLLRRLGEEGVTHLLVEGGGEVNGAFLIGGYAHRVAFFYAPLILGGRDARRGVAGVGAESWSEVPRLQKARWQRLGTDLLLISRVSPREAVGHV